MSAGLDVTYMCLQVKEGAYLQERVVLQVHSAGHLCCMVDSRHLHSSASHQQPSSVRRHRRRHLPACMHALKPGQAHGAPSHVHLCSTGPSEPSAIAGAYPAFNRVHRHSERLRPVTHRAHRQPNIACHDAHQHVPPLHVWVPLCGRPWIPDGHFQRLSQRAPLLNRVLQALSCPGRVPLGQVFQRGPHLCAAASFMPSSTPLHPCLAFRQLGCSRRRAV